MDVEVEVGFVSLYEKHNASFYLISSMYSHTKYPLGKFQGSNEVPYGTAIAVVYSTRTWSNPVISPYGESCVTRSAMISTRFP